jgi:hypothetical protein
MQGNAPVHKEAAASKTTAVNFAAVTAAERTA